MELINTRTTTTIVERLELEHETVGDIGPFVSGFFVLQV